MQNRPQANDGSNSNSNNRSRSRANNLVPRVNRVVPATSGVPQASGVVSSAPRARRPIPQLLVQPRGRAQPISPVSGAAIPSARQARQPIAQAPAVVSPAQQPIPPHMRAQAPAVVPPAQQPIPPHMRAQAPVPALPLPVLDNTLIRDIQKMAEDLKVIQESGMDLINPAQWAHMEHKLIGLKASIGGVASIHQMLSIHAAFNHYESMDAILDRKFKTAMLFDDMNHEISERGRVLDRIPRIPRVGMDRQDRSRSRGRNYNSQSDHEEKYIILNNDDGVANAHKTIERNRSKILHRNHDTEYVPHFVKRFVLTAHADQRSLKRVLSVELGKEYRPSDFKSTDQLSFKTPQVLSIIVLAYSDFGMKYGSPDDKANYLCLKDDLFAAIGPWMAVHDLYAIGICLVATLNDTSLKVSDVAPTLRDRLAGLKGDASSKIDIEWTGGLASEVCYNNFIHDCQKDRYSCSRAHVCPYDGLKHKAHTCPSITKFVKSKLRRGSYTPSRGYRGNRGYRGYRGGYRGYRGQH
eukprot:526032_1